MVSNKSAQGDNSMVNSQLTKETDQFSGETGKNQHIVHSLDHQRKQISNF